jgi:1,4-dihydroxy-6-naphthoate synthase
MTPISLAYSPCPNDTFMFHQLSTPVARIDGHPVTIHLHDVDELNSRALKQTYDVTKLSCHAYFHVEEQYSLLNAGAAFGFGCGPILVARPGALLSHVRQGSVAIPGELTTAHLLLQLKTPDIGRRIFTTYNQILPMVRDGLADFGLVIHEGRFTYEEYGLVRILDLGAWWESETKLPIPLGGIAAKRSLGKNTGTLIESAIRDSLTAAQTHPETTRDYVLQHASELSCDIIDLHINTFVNDFSMSIGEEGQEALLRLRTMAKERGILP